MSFLSTVTERATDPISVACFDQFTLFSDLNQSFELHVHVHSDFVISASCIPDA